NFGYAGTGNDGNSTSDFWQYDPVNDSWTEQATFGGSPRNDAFGFSAGGKGYIGFGNISGYAGDLWEYTPDSVATSTPDYELSEASVSIFPNPMNDYSILRI